MEIFFLEVYVCWRHERAQLGYEARSRNWIWLDKFTSYVIIGLENHFEGRNRIEKSIRTWNVSKSAVWKNRRVGWY